MGNIRRSPDTVIKMKNFDITDCIPFWAELSDENRKLIKDNLVTRTYVSSERILLNRAKKNGMIFILSGCIRVFLASDTGREITLFRLNKGEVFSIMTVDQAGDLDVVPLLEALEKSSVAYLSEDVLARIAYSVPKMAQFVYRNAAKNAQLIINNIAYMFFNTLRGCIARYIIVASKKNGPSCDTVKTTHEEIANHLGSTRVVISRELDSLRDMGLIQTRRGSIIIVDREGLESIAGR